MRAPALDWRLLQRPATTERRACVYNGVTILTGDAADIQLLVELTCARNIGVQVV